MKTIKLHIGCGKIYIPSFIHIDINDFPHVDYVTSAEELDIFKDSSIDLIYSSCLLEHFEIEELYRTLHEWKRVLKKGGILRVSVPDFEKIVKVYRKYKNWNTMFLLQGLIHGKQDVFENTHYISFDFKLLKRILKEIGFKNIRRYDWRKTIHKDYDDYSQAYIPHMNKKKGILMSLNVEAEK